MNESFNSIVFLIRIIFIRLCKYSIDWNKLNLFSPEDPVEFKFKI